MEDEIMNQPKLKRWSFLDTLNASLLIVSILFLIDFEEQAIISWLLIGVFTLWAVFLIFRNVVITKAKNDPNHPMHSTLIQDEKPKDNLKK